jgi:hypothetical protein
MEYELNCCPYNAKHGKTRLEILFVEKRYLEFIKTYSERDQERIKVMLSQAPQYHSAEPCVAIKVYCDSCGLQTHLSNFFEEDNPHSLGFHAGLRGLVIAEYSAGRLTVVDNVASLKSLLGK